MVGFSGCWSWGRLLELVSFLHVAIRPKSALECAKNMHPNRTVEWRHQEARSLAQPQKIRIRRSLRSSEIHYTTRFNRTTIPSIIEFKGTPAQNRNTTHCKWTSLFCQLCFQPISMKATTRSGSGESCEQNGRFR